MDLVSAIATGTTFVTFVKDIAIVAMAVKDAIEKTGENLQDAKDACEDIVLLLEGLLQIGQEQGDQAFTHALSHSRGDWFVLEQFKRDLLRFHRTYMAVISNWPPSHLATGWRAWHRLWSIGWQQSTAKDLARLKDSVNGIMRRFQAIALAQLQHTQLQQTNMLQRAEHSNRLLLAETPGGRRAVARRRQLANTLLGLPLFLRRWHGHIHSQSLYTNDWKTGIYLDTTRTSRSVFSWRTHNEISVAFKEYYEITILDLEVQSPPVSLAGAVVSAAAAVSKSLLHLDGKESHDTYSYFYDALLPAPHVLLEMLSSTPRERATNSRRTKASTRFYWNIRTTILSGIWSRESMGHEIIQCDLCLETFKQRPRKDEGRVRKHQVGNVE